MTPSTATGIGTRSGTAAVTAPLVEVEHLSRSFDVSAPWLNRVVERKPKQFVHAVDDVGFAIARGSTLALLRNQLWLFV